MDYYYYTLGLSLLLFKFIYYDSIIKVHLLCQKYAFVFGTVQSRMGQDKVLPKVSEMTPSHIHETHLFL